MLHELAARAGEAAPLLNNCARGGEGADCAVPTGPPAIAPKAVTHYLVQKKPCRSSTGGVGSSLGYGRTIFALFGCVADAARVSLSAIEVPSVGRSSAARHGHGRNLVESACSGTDAGSRVGRSIP